ncbi:bifunctional enoyl-CoA hydratase/phosphate acetyltransferase [Moorellaceae bacterium AZ2]
MTRLEQLLELAKGSHPQRVAVIAPHEPEVLRAIKEATKKQLIQPILIGHSSVIKSRAAEIGYGLDSAIMLEEEQPEIMVELAISLINSGKADIIMKGLIPTSKIMKAVVRRESGLRTGRIMSHVALLEVKNLDRLIILTDSGVNIAPDFFQKVGIIENAIEVGHKLGLENPRVALLAAVEAVDERMPATVEAAQLVEMFREKKLRAFIDGPLALDLAVSPAAAGCKKINSPVAGRADILVAPYIEVANVLLKSLIYFAGAKTAQVVVGAKVPIVLTSRADSWQAKLYSLALGAGMLR